MDRELFLMFLKTIVPFGIVFKYLSLKKSPDLDKQSQKAYLKTFFNVFLEAFLFLMFLMFLNI